MPWITHRPARLLTTLVAWLIAALVVPAAALSAQRPYYPGPGGEWARRSPRDVGMDSVRLADAIAFAIQRESRSPRDLEIAHYQSFGREPFGEGIGPFKERGDPTGLVVRNGYVVATWGDLDRVDMTFSVTKSFLSTTVGLALDRGMIKSLKDSVRNYVAPVVPLGDPARVGARAGHLGEPTVMQPFDSPHNRRITWDDLLRQTSDWEGTLWGKPEWADRPGQNPSEWRTRKRSDPGTTYEYNDVRVNVLALAALEVWRRPLPHVLREHVMDPIGASNTWRWHGYENSWIVLDGQALQSVSGGGHWGGGMFINARDMARFGYLTLRRGRWRERQILSEDWIRQALTPTAAQPTYGFMNFFLNTDRRFIASAPPSAFAHMGNGTNMIYVDPENDLVVVVRWIENGAINEFVQKVLGSIVGRGARGGSS